jgi:hypothetical protein
MELPAATATTSPIDRIGLVLSRNAWLVLVTLVICLGATVAFWKAERRIAAAQQAQRPLANGNGAKGDNGSATTPPAPLQVQAPVQQVLNIGDGTRLCGSVDVHVRKSVPHGDLVGLLQRVDSVIVDGPDFGGIIRLRIFARDSQRALAELQRSPLLDAVTLLPHCR